MGNNRDDIRTNKKKFLTKEERIKIKRTIEKKKRKKRKKRIISSIFLIFLILIISGVFYCYSILNGLKTNNLGTGIAPASSSDPINILVLGMDIGDTENLDNSLARRSDTIMVFNYNPNTKKAHLVSIPRDTLIEVDGYLDTGEYQRYWKINAAYALGGEEEVISHVESLLDISINYIVEVDYNAFRSIVDALGGVEMTIEQDMNYDDDEQDLHIHFNAGETVTLDGQGAEEFFRWRQNNDGTGLANGDLDRIKNQQLLISKLVDKALSPSIVFKVPRILNAITENVDTNIPANELLSLGMKILKLNSSDIIMTTLKGEAQNIYGQDYIVAYDEYNKELVEVLNATDSSTNMSSIEKGNLKVLVLNGTKIEGLASSVREKLENLGYSNIEIGNTTSVLQSEVQTTNKELREVLAEDIDIEKFGKISESQYKDYDVVILLGEDYNLF